MKITEPGFYWIKPDNDSRFHFSNNSMDWNIVQAVDRYEGLEIMLLGQDLAFKPDQLNFSEVVKIIEPRE